MPNPARTRLSVSLLLVLAACGSRGPEDLTAKLLYTASGSYDAQADVRDRVNRSTRTVLWVEKPPLDAQRVEVTYASESRQVAWNMVVTAPKFTVQDILNNNPQDGAVRATPQGQGALFTGGRLKKVLVMPLEGGLRFVTQGWAVQREPALLPLFDSSASGPGRAK